MAKSTPQTKPNLFGTLTQKPVKEAKKDTQTFKKGVKKAGNDIKDAGKEIGNTFKDIFN